MRVAQSVFQLQYVLAIHVQTVAKWEHVYARMVLPYVNYVLNNTQQCEYYK